MRRMRVFGMEKFNNPTFIATVNYYLNTQEMEKKAVWGLLAVYVEQDYLGNLIQLLEYPDVDDENPEDMKDACGSLCNLIGGQFRTDLIANGFANLEMSHFSSYSNSSLSGAEFYNKVREKYEISFYIGGEKRLVAEFTIGPLPKA